LEEALADAVVALGSDHSIERAWECALTSARRFVAEARRAARHQAQVDPELEPDDVAADVARDEVLAARWALWEWEEAALSVLTPLQRAALELHEMDGLSDEQIAGRIGSTAASVQKLRGMAKRRIRELVNRGELRPPTSADT